MTTRDLLQRLPERLKAPLRVIFEGFARGYRGLMTVGMARRHLCLVVCGFPRSGTSLLYNMLSSSMSRIEFTDFEVPAIHGLRRWGSIASKSPSDLLEIESLAAGNMFGKRILVIVTVRDVRDVITSRHPVVPDRYFIGYEASWWPSGGFDDWVYDGPGVAALDAALQGLLRASGSEIMAVRYEDLVTDPDSVQRTIADVLGLEFDSPFSSFHERQDRLAYRYEGNTAPRNADLVRENRRVEPGRAGKWQAAEHDERIRSEFLRHPELFAILRQYGYEQDDEWFDRYV